MDNQLPTIYVTDKVIWEYSHLVRDVTKEGALTENELNSLGSEGWELAGVLEVSGKAHLYFKRPKD